MAINHRNIYLNTLATILPSTAAKNAFKTWAATNSIDTIYLYDLNTILASSTLKTHLANFLIDLRTNTAVTGVFAARGDYPLPYAAAPYYGFTDINAYNLAQSNDKARIGTYDATSRKGGMITEYEWYLTYSTDPIVNSNTQLSRSETLRQLQNNMINWRNNYNNSFAGVQAAPEVRVYMGQFKPVGYELKQAKLITSYWNNGLTFLTPRMHQLNLSCYVDCRNVAYPSGGTYYSVNYPVFFNWIRTRLTWFAKAAQAGYFNVTPGAKINWCPIFSYEPAFMQYAASTTGGNKSFDTIFNDMLTQLAAWIAAASPDALLVSQYMRTPDEYTIFSYTNAVTARP